MYGSRTNSEGYILFKNATITTKIHENAPSHTLINQEIGNYTSVPSDSGAPIVAYEDNVAKIVGIHSGTAYIFELPSEGFAHVDYSNKNHDQYGRYRPDGFKYYKGFSHWENVLEELNLQ